MLCRSQFLPGAQDIASVAPPTHAYQNHVHGQAIPLRHTVAQCFVEGSSGHVPTRALGDNASADLDIDLDADLDELWATIPRTLCQSASSRTLSALNPKGIRELR